MIHLIYTLTWILKLPKVWRHLEIRRLFQTLDFGLRLVNMWLQNFISYLCPLFSLILLDKAHLRLYILFQLKFGPKENNIIHIVKLVGKYFAQTASSQLKISTLIWSWAIRYTSSTFTSHVKGFSRLGINFVIESNKY